MSHWLSGALVVAVLLLAGCTATAEETAAGSATAGDSLFSLAGNGGYDVDHYTLDLDVFHGLTVESVIVDGDDATFSRDGDELTITPDGTLGREASFTTTIRYSGTPTAISLAGVPDDLGWHHFDGGIYTVSEPIGAKTWFPNNNHPLDKATYEPADGQLRTGDSLRTFPDVCGLFCWRSGRWRMLFCGLHAAGPSGDLGTRCPTSANLHSCYAVGDSSCCCPPSYGEAIGSLHTRTGP